MKFSKANKKNFKKCWLRISTKTSNFLTEINFKLSVSTCIFSIFFAMVFQGEKWYESYMTQSTQHTLAAASSSNSTDWLKLYQAD